MKVKVANIAFSKNNFLVEKLLEEFPDAEFNSKGTRINYPETIEYFSDAEAIVVGLEKIDDDLLSKLPNLKMIAKFGVGIDNIDIDACLKRNILVGWTGGVNKRSVAEMAIGFMIALSRNLFVTSNQLKEGLWNKNGGTQLSGKTVGIIGFGNIGKELVKLLEPFGCKIIVNDITNLENINESFDLQQVSKDYMFREADIISIHTPLTSETKNLINSSVFEIMKPSSIIINTARGGIINEIDLKEALEKGLISGAALDVYNEEPPSDLNLLKQNNFICTPHIGGNSYEAVVAMGMSALDHLLNFKKQTTK
jgi:phosphoglycerate dehydrogenase-like enzyme